MLANDISRRAVTSAAAKGHKIRGGCPVSCSEAGEVGDVGLYYIKNQQDATLAVLFISNCNITLHVSDASCVHHQEY